MLNTASLLLRTVLTVGLSFFVVRFVLGAMGSSDYGIFMVVGATLPLLLVFNSALTDAATRHMSFAIGKGDDAALHEYFTTALGLYVGLGAILAAIGLFGNQLAPLLLTIPEGREAATATVFLTTALMFSLKSIEAPFMAAAHAHQKQWIEAIVGTLNAVMKFGFAFWLTKIKGDDVDELVTWAWMLLGVEVVQSVFVMALAITLVPAARPRASLFRMKRVRGLFSFGGWTVLEALSWRIRMQGMQVLINILFPQGQATPLNGSFGIATQLASYQRSLTGPVRKAVLPVVVTSYSGQDNESVHRLVLVTGKYLFYMAALILIPVMFDCLAVLELWLGREKVAELPQVVPLVQLIALWMIYQRISDGFIFANRATGRLAVFTTVLFSLDMMSVVIAAVFVETTDLGVLSMPIASFFMILMQVTFAAWHAGKRIGIPMSLWVSKTLIPAHIPVVAGVGASFAIAAAMEPGIVRFLLIASTNGLLIAGLAWAFGMEDWEREHYARLPKKLVRKLRGRGVQPPEEEARS